MTMLHNACPPNSTNDPRQNPPPPKKKHCNAPAALQSMQANRRSDCDPVRSLDAANRIGCVPLTVERDGRCNAACRATAMSGGVYGPNASVSSSAPPPILLHVWPPQCIALRKQCLSPCTNQRDLCIQSCLSLRGRKVGCPGSAGVMDWILHKTGGHAPPSSNSRRRFPGAVLPPALCLSPTGLIVLRVPGGAWTKGCRVGRCLRRWTALGSLSCADSVASTC